ncbi:MAG TPA: hypothetical protein VGB62_10945 [Allosphingosinicella sp.]|jgi:hypothetical protein
MPAADAPRKVVKPLRAFSTTLVVSLSAMIASHSLLQHPAFQSEPPQAVPLPDDSVMLAPTKKVRADHNIVYEETSTIAAGI